MDVDLRSRMAQSFRARNPRDVILIMLYFCKVAVRAIGMLGQALDAALANSGFRYKVKMLSLNNVPLSVGKHAMFELGRAWVR